MPEDILAMREFSFAPPEGGRCDLLVIAGEHSGDEQAARMLNNVFKLKPDLRVCAFGGACIGRTGAQLLFDMTAFSVVGLAEVLKNYAFFKKLSEAVVDWICLHKPGAVCFVDYPGFNMHIASILKERGVSVKGGGDVKTLYYISPQIWAWKSKRRFKMADTLDALAVIFPFEVECYADTSLRVDFVGHPFLEKSYVSPVKYDPDGEILLLAGSRSIAVSRIFPIMLEALRLIPGRRKAVAVYPTNAIKDRLERALRRNPDAADRVRLVGNESGVIGVRAAMMSSGTMSLACSLEGIPGAIVYKANPITYLVGRSLVKIKYLSIANILLDKPAWREFIQFEASPRKLAKYMRHCISDSSERGKFLSYSDKLRSLLHAPKNMGAADWLVERLGV